MPGDSSYLLFSDTLVDTIYYIQPGGDTIQVIKWGSGQTIQHHPLNRETEKQSMDTNTVLLIILMFVIVVLSQWLSDKFTPKEKEELTPAQRRKKAAETIKSYGKLYDELLTKYNPYYAGLSDEMKSRFLHRTIEFAQAKDFKFHELEEDDSMLVLISGAAVQLTFGLPNFLMDYFRVIHVIRKEYTLHHDNETYYGHVSRNGIYISWNHFAKGYLDYTDGVNVGLHEMAHAISYDVFLGYQDRHDRGFKKRLQEFRIEGGPVYRALKQGDPHLLDSYAATNFDEFWAVCIETFFEQPEDFRDEEPELYTTICELLNQDPTMPDKIIDKKRAGIRY